MGDAWEHGVRRVHLALGTCMVLGYAWSRMVAQRGELMRTATRLTRTEKHGAGGGAGGGTGRDTGQGARARRSVTGWERRWARRSERRWARRWARRWGRHWERRWARRWARRSVTGWERRWAPSLILVAYLLGRPSGRRPRARLPSVHRTSERASPASHITWRGGQS